MKRSQLEGQVLDLALPCHYCHHHKNKSVGKFFQFYFTQQIAGKGAVFFSYRSPQKIQSKSAYKLACCKFSLDKLCYLERFNQKVPICLRCCKISLDQLCLHNQKNFFRSQNNPREYTGMK